MDFLEKHVSTQYSDYSGKIEVDFKEGGSLSKLCKDYDVDISEYFVIGFGFFEYTTNGIAQHDEASINILLLDKHLYGDTFDKALEEIKSNNREIEVLKKTIYVPYSKLGLYIKRFDFLAINELRTTISKMVIKEEE